MFESANPDLVVMLAKQHQEDLRRAAGEARLRRSMPRHTQHRQRWRRK